MAPRYNSRLWREVVKRFKDGWSMESIPPALANRPRYSLSDIEHIIRWALKKCPEGELKGKRK